MSYESYSDYKDRFVSDFDEIKSILSRSFKVKYTDVQIEIIAEAVENKKVSIEEFNEVVRGLAVKSNITPAPYEVINALPEKYKVEEKDPMIDFEKNRKTIANLIDVNRFNDSQMEKIYNVCETLNLPIYEELNNIHKMCIYKILQHKIDPEKIKEKMFYTKNLLQALGVYAVQNNIKI